MHTWFLLIGSGSFAKFSKTGEKADAMKKRRNPTVESLQSDPEYHLALELSFQDIIPFVLKNIRKRGVMSWLYFIVNLGMLGIIIAQIIMGFIDHSLSWQRMLLQTLSGIFAGSILVIPLHELIHGLAYRILGARQIKFGADLQQFFFYVTADRHPVSGFQILFLALLPFLIINAIAGFITIQFAPQALLFTSLFLLSHNIMCIGDFAISNFVQRSEKRIFSFDEIKEKKSYFYELVRK